MPALSLIPPLRDESNQLMSRLRRRLGLAAGMIIVGVGAGCLLQPGLAGWPDQVLFALGLVCIAGLTAFGLLCERRTAGGALVVLLLLIGLSDWLTWLHPSPPSSYLTMIPIAGALLLYGRWAMVGMIVLMLSTQGAVVLLRGPLGDREPLLAGLVIALFAMDIVDLSRSELRARREAEALVRERDEANRRLHVYAQQAEQLAAQRERAQLARDIHDGLGHYLTAAGIQAQTAQAYLAGDPARAARALQSVEEMIAGALAEARRSVLVLRDQNQPPLQTVAAIRRLVAGFEDEGGAAVQCRIAGEDADLPPAVGLALYRGAQEALTNIRKHARAARHVRITLELTPTLARLGVADDGAGFDPTQAGPRADGSGFGLLSLRERLATINGTVDLRSAPGAGTTLVVTIPYHNPGAGA